MKRTALTSLAALTAACALAVTGCSSDGGSSDSSGGSSDGGDTVKIGIKYDQPGLGFKNGDSFEGFDVDVATYVAEKLGYDQDHIEFVESPSANRENMLENGQVDMIFATYSITDARKEKVSFAGPYFIAGQDLLVRKDDSSITSVEDLEGKNLCSVTGSTSATTIKEEVPGVNLVEQSGYSECMTVLESGSVDAVTTDDIILAGLAATEANKGKFQLVGKTFSEEKYGVGIPKDSDKCEDINSAITEMIDSGEWDKAIESATEGTNYQYNKDLNPPTPDECD